MLGQDHQTTSARSQRGFLPLLVATGVSVSGDGALTIAGPLLAVALTSDPVAVSLVTAATYLPWLLVSLPAGALVDQWPKRPVMVWTSVIPAVVLGLFCILMITGQGTVTTLVISIFLVNVAQCFFAPASQSIIPKIVGRDENVLRRANGQYLSVDGIGRALIGPLAGAWLFTAGRVLPFFADVVSFVVAALFLRRLPIIPPAATAREPIPSAVRNGFKLLFSIRELLVLALGSAAYNIGYFAAISTFALYTRDVLHVGDIGFGALFTVLASASILTGWLGTGLIRDLPSLSVRAVTLAIPGVAWLVAAAASNIWVTGALFACIGATAVLGSVTIGAASQRLAPEDSVGRISSIVRLLAFGGSGLGALVGGWAASGWGLPAPLIVAGTVQVASAAAIWLVRDQARDARPPRQ